MEGCRSCLGLRCYLLVEGLKTRRDVLDTVLERDTLKVKFSLSILFKMAGELWMLPCPLELERCKPGWEPVDDHGHNPGSAKARPESTLFEFAIVLSDAAGWIWRAADIARI